MLPATIDELIAGRLPEQETRQHLLALTIDRIDDRLIKAFVDRLSATLDDDSRSLASLENALDCSGTGGSGLPHFNTSTTSAFVLAAAGVRVTKFGNRAAQSASGSFDLLEALAIPLHLPAAAVPDLLEETGLVFLFAQQYYSCLSKIAPLRKALGVKTIFNTIGPLLNPVQPAFRVMGTGDERAQKLVADRLSQHLPTRRALVVRSQAGMDELEPGSENCLLNVSPGSVEVLELAPRPVVHDTEVRAFTTRENLALFHLIIANQGPQYFRDLVSLNAGAGLLAAGVVDSVESGDRLARNVLASGAVKDKYEQCRRAYAAYAG